MNLKTISKLGIIELVLFLAAISVGLIINRPRDNIYASLLILAIAIFFFAIGYFHKSNKAYFGSLIIGLSSIIIIFIDVVKK